MQHISFISKAIVVGFEGICILMAVYMTYKQLKIFYQNEDFSEISFQKFTDGENDKYPTYTICFTDNYEQQIYQKQHLSTSKGSITKAFPYGKRINVEDNKLVIMNRTSIRETYSYGDYNVMKTDNGSFHLAWGFKAGTEAQLVKKHTTGREDRYVDLGISWMGENMILMKTNQKTYTISPKQYQLLLLGQTLPFMYGVNSVHHENMIVEMNTTIADIMQFQFDDLIVDFSQFLVDFEVEMENGSTYGWHTNRYKEFQTFCHADALRRVKKSSDSPVWVSFNCYEENSFRTHLENKIPSGYPLEKVYQDPGKICYSPKLDPNIYRNSEMLTFDLKDMFYKERQIDDQQFRTKSSLPFIKIYVHMQGQFIRKIGKEVASYTAKDATIYCSSFPYPPRHFYEEHDCYGTRLSFDVSEVTLLRSRHDAKQSCDVELKDEDSKIIETLIKDEMLNCRPLYWKGLKSIPSIDDCTNFLQYKYISEISNNFTNFRKIRNHVNPPCEEMIIVTNVQTRKGRKLSWKNLNDNQQIDENEQELYWDIQFSNINERYQVTENSRAFTGESCWAGIGGFVGIFVGMSLMQVPDLLCKIYQIIKLKALQCLEK